MKRIFFATILIFSIFFQLTPASSVTEIKIKVNTTYKVARTPMGKFQPIPLDDRVFLKSTSEFLTPKEDQLFWIDKNFKVNALVLNSKQLAGPGGFIAFNNQYFFTAYMKAEKRVTNNEDSVLSLDKNNKVRKWDTPGYDNCRIGYALREFLYLTCYVDGRSQTYNRNRVGSSSDTQNFDIEAIFAISKSNTITKIDLPTKSTLDAIWLGNGQLLLQSDSTNPSQLSYYYLENGKVTYQFDLPDSVRVRALTSLGWTLNIPKDFDKSQPGCPSITVLSPEGQFMQVDSPQVCTGNAVDEIKAGMTMVAALSMHGFSGGKNYELQGEQECRKLFKAKSPRFIGFFNGKVLCYDDQSRTDNLIHAFPSTYKNQNLPAVPFPSIKQSAVPKAGYPCPVVVNTGKENGPKVLGFKFNATGQNFVRIGDGTNSEVKEPAGLVGCYADFETLSDSPEGNTYAVGTINHDSAGYYWLNQAGVKWGLTLSGSIMITDKDNPYYSDGNKFMLTR